MCFLAPASTGFSTSKVRSIYNNGRGEHNKHNANSLLSATEDQALLYAAQRLAMPTSLLPMLSDQNIIDALLTNKSARDCVLQPVYKAERLIFTHTTIRASFRSVGLVPWDPTRVLHLAGINLGMDLPSYGVADAAQAAATAVIRLSHDRHMAGKKKVVAGRAAVEKRRLYSAADLVAADRARVAAKVPAEKAKAAKDAQKETTKLQVARDKVEQERQRVLATCRVCTSRVHCGGKLWTVCGCGEFRVCPMCMKQSVGNTLVAAHVMGCLQRG